MTMVGSTFSTKTAVVQWADSVDFRYEAVAVLSGAYPLAGTQSLSESSGSPDAGACAL